MKKSIFMFTLLLCYASLSTAANILAIFLTASRSHYIWTSPIAIALANKGHNVTVLSPQGEKNPIPNVTFLVMNDLYEDASDNYSFEDMADLPPLHWIQEVFTFFEEQCKLVMKTEAFKQLMDYLPDTVFDLIIIEAIGVECFQGILPNFGSPPIVAVNAYSVPHWVLEITGTPNVPSHIPNVLLPYSDHMTFVERIENFLATVYTYYCYHYDYLPSMDKAAAAYFGSQLPLTSAYKIAQNISVVMANFHPTLDYPWAVSPSLIPVGGLQIRDSRPLPLELQNFLDNASEGAIFFSLGSNVRSDKLSAEKRKAILDAFAELPQKVLWKFESDLTGLPKNVKVGKWLPQTDILAHPNVKLFITHSGLLSTHETVHRGIPVVGIPFLADQHINIRRMVKHGCGVLLEYRELTKETLLQAVRTVLEDPSYTKNMKELSARFRDDPQTPLERAIFWIEYVLRHKGAPHLQSGAKDLNLIQYFLLDVIAFLLIVPTILIIVIYSICCRKKTKQQKKSKMN